MCGHADFCLNLDSIFPSFRLSDAVFLPLKASDETLTQCGSLPEQYRLVTACSISFHNL